MTLDRHVAELLARTGVGAQLLQEAEAQRAASFEEARRRKRAAVTKFLAQRPKADARFNDAEDRVEAARKALNGAIDELRKARQARDQVHDEFTAQRNQLDAELRQHADPRVEALKVELEAIRRGPTFRRSTHEEMSAAASQVADLIRETERLRIAGELGDVSDIGAALEAVRARIPR